MVDVNVVAQYILTYCHRMNVCDCSNKKLQKLLYYVQAWSLAFRNKPMFENQVEAWLHGPVVSEIYHKYKKFGYNPLPCPRSFKDDALTKDDKKLLESVLNGYSKYDAEYLEMRTHIEQPWIDARMKDEQIISSESMRDYYRDVLNRAQSQR